MFWVLKGIFQEILWFKKNNIWNKYTVLSHNWDLVWYWKKGTNIKTNKQSKYMNSESFPVPETML